MAVLAFKQEWPGFDGDGMHKTPFPPLNHDKMPSGVSRSESQFYTSIFHRDCLMKRIERGDKIGKSRELIGSWLVRCKLLVPPQALCRM